MSADLEHKQNLIHLEIIPRICNLLLYKNPNILMPTIRTIEKLTSDSEGLIDELINHGLL